MSLVTGADSKQRCWWCNGDEDYVNYHDTEWGFPQFNDHRLFEKICLEGFQAGLSWLMILRKRERFREVFAGFDPEVITTFTPSDVERLLSDKGIIRHRGKIEATINNAGLAIKLIDEIGSLSEYFWSFDPNREGALTEIPSVTDASTALSVDLKARGWRFVGPTTAYAFMQAMGLVNDHLEGCYVREDVESVRKKIYADKVR